MFREYFFDLRCFFLTEKEKLLAGKIYDSSDTELVCMRQKAHRLSQDYNQTYETETEKRDKILKM